MCISAVLGAIGVGVTAVGTVMQYQASMKNADIEETRMELEAQRHKRIQYREMLRSQAQAETAGASAGALSSSGVMGGINQAANAGFQSIRDTNQNEQLGHQQFAAKRQEALGGTVASLCGGLSSLGNQFVKNQETITRIGRTGVNNKWAYTPSLWNYG